MVEVRQIISKSIWTVLALCVGAGVCVAQQPRIKGLKDNAQYMSLMHREVTLQQDEAQIKDSIQFLRHRLQQAPSQQSVVVDRLISLEQRMIQLQMDKNRVVDSINLIEKQWIASHFDEPQTKSVSSTAQESLALKSLKRKCASQPQTSNLIDNPCFGEELSEIDFQTLKKAQEKERLVRSYLERSLANYDSMSELSLVYDSVRTETEAIEVQERFASLKKENEHVLDSLSKEWNYIFDNKLYAYGYLMDKLRLDEVLQQEEQNLETVTQKYARMQGQFYSDVMCDYVLRKTYLNNYEQKVAEILGLTKAQDSLRVVAQALQNIPYRNEDVVLRERLFIQYEPIAFSRTPKYSYKEPIPECRIYEKGLIYRILLGTFNTKRAVSTFRGAYPLSYLINENKKWEYFAGGFESLQEAEEAVRTLKKRGFLRPEIMMWKDAEKRNITRNPITEKISYRVEVRGASQISEEVRKAVQQHAEGFDFSRVGAQLFVIGIFEEKTQAEQVLNVLREHAAELETKIVEIKSVSE